MKIAMQRIELNIYFMHVYACLCMIMYVYDSLCMFMLAALVFMHRYLSFTNYGSPSEHNHKSPLPPFPNTPLGSM